MSLFPYDSTVNILPQDGEVYYYGQVFNQIQANDLMKKLTESIQWKNDEVKIFGKTHITGRKVSWYGDKPYIYSYAGSEKTALLWTKELLEIKEMIEKLTQTNYNSCLLNYYHHGNESMGWHRDNERILKKNAPIASVSFGAIRDFQFRHIETKEKKSLQLGHGSLLIMAGQTQDNWQHQLPKRKKVEKPRVNLTFRTILD